MHLVASVHLFVCLFACILLGARLSRMQQRAIRVITSLKCVSNQGSYGLLCGCVRSAFNFHDAFNFFPPAIKIVRRTIDLKSFLALISFFARTIFLPRYVYNPEEYGRSWKHPVNGPTFLTNILRSTGKDYVSLIFKSF